MHSVFGRRKLHLLSLGAFALTSLCASRAAAQGGEPQSFAIRGAKIVTVSGPPLENGTVVVTRGVITAVGTNVTPPPEAWVIDGKGLIVYPGLIDSFTDVGIVAVAPAGGGAEGGPRPQQPTSRGPEDRPASTPWRNAADEASPADKRIENWRSAGFTTVVSAPKGGIFPGQGAVLNLAGERAGDLVVKSPVAVPVSLQPPGGFANFPGSLMGVLGYVRQVWLDTDWYTKALAIYDKNPRGIERPRYDRTASALSEALEDHALVLIPANTALQIRRAFELAERWKVSAAIYGGQQGYEAAGEIAAKKMPVLVNLQWPEKPKDADPDAEPSLRPLRFRDRAPGTPAAFAKAGVKFAFYSGGISAPKDMLKAVKKSIDAGLPSDVALRALTLTTAEIFGVADRLGSIETGKIANLVVADGDLFAEKTKVKIVFVDGHKFEVREPTRPTEPPKGDMSGKWKLSYTTPEGPEESTAELTMAGDGTLSGTVASTRGTATIINGWVSADKFNFTINFVLQGQPTDVTFSGTFEGNSMKGSIDVQGFTIDFTGSKPGAEVSAAAGE